MLGRVFPAAHELLKTREGSLEQVPLPLLLNAFRAEGKSGGLELKLRQLEKRLYFEDGSLVACDSNLAHETLGKFLVERGKLTLHQHQQLLAESISTGAAIEGLLVQKGLLTAFELYKQLQANLAHRILDCFRWVDARYRLLSEPPEDDSPVRVKTARLIVVGCTSSLPFSAVEAHLPVLPQQRFALLQPAPLELSELKLTAKDTRFFQVLRARPSLLELQTQTGLDTEAVLRRLFAFGVLGLVAHNESVAQPAPQPAPPPAPSPASAPRGVSFLDEDAVACNALTAEFLEHRKKDPFELLGVGEEAGPAQLRAAFLAKASRFPPVRFESQELRERAETLLAALARAYGALSEPEQLALHKKRRQIAREQAQAPKPSTAAEQFRIRTTLLDAGTQFAEGKTRLAAGEHRAAVDYFQYAFDIEPKPLHQAYLALARFQFNPAANARLALHELAEAQKADSCEEAWAFAADIHWAQGNLAEADSCYRRAFKLNPRERRYPEALKTLARQLKG